MPSRHAHPPTSHRRPPSTGLAVRIASRSGLLLSAAVALAVLATVALVAPASSSTSLQTVDAAAIRTLAATDGRSDAECRLVVPDAPLTAKGLATPYRLTSTSWQNGDCHEANAKQAAFVEAVVYDPQAHSLAVYHPLVVDSGTTPAAAPVPVELPANSVVGLWVGFNGNKLNLTGPGAGRCVDGVHGSSFGHFAYCNASAFFAAVNNDHQVVVPPVGTGQDGLPCPTSRDFSVVDQHQADYVTTAYRVVNGRMAQNTPGTGAGKALTNIGGHLLGGTIDAALGCKPFTAPDLTNGGTPTTALALDELSAAANQTRPAALVPASDPLVSGAHGQTLVGKTNVYRAGVNQPPFPSGQSRADYCGKILDLAPTRLKKDAALFHGATSPVAQGQDLMSYLALRLQATLHGLGCGTNAAVKALAAQAAGSSGSSAPGTPSQAGGSSTSSAPSSSSSSSSSSASGTSSSSGGVTVPLPPNGPTLWGSSVMAYGGESYTTAFDRVQSMLHPQIIRFFNGGTNGPQWPSKTGNAPLAISFKIPPAQVLNGSYDAQLRSFFAATPQKTFWTYWHEPEDDIAAGSFTAADYRAAWTHIAAIAKASGKPLVATLILMGWTTQPASHRTWTDYYPGPNVIDVLAWDCYATTTTSTPQSMYGNPLAASIAAGKPWAIAETAASASRFPDPAKRDALLTAMSHYLATASQKPVFVTYFDSDNSGQVNGNISEVPAAAAAWMRGQAG